MKTRIYPDLPLVLVEWVDAAGDRDAEVDPADPISMRAFGGAMKTLEPGWLVRIDKDNVVCALSKWPEEKRGGAREHHPARHGGLGARAGRHGLLRARPPAPAPARPAE